MMRKNREGDPVIRKRKPGKALFPMAFGVTAVLLYGLNAFGLLSGNAQRYLLQIYLYITLGEAWNLLNGYAGMTSLGQQLYVGLAGYALTVVTGLYQGSLSAALALGVLVSVLAALALSWILFRLRGMFFAICTWVAAEAAKTFFLSWNYVNQGGGMTVQLPYYPSLHQIYFMALTLCLCTVGTVCLLLRSRLGLALMTIRDDPEAAASIGVHLKKTQLTVFVLSAAICSLAGSLLFLNKGVIYPESGFSTGWTVSCVFICVIGGSGTVSGPVIGAVLYILLREFLANYPGWSNMILGFFTILTILFLPEGLMGTLQRRLKLPLFARRPPAQTNHFR